ncbi:F-box/LRR-repeat protein 7 [Lingula anatina]|uniref:F-box/LRR-repeat protein 7 n=1 Tax=Lingula anatina TaxID=7574 RepID=A0A1S3JXJ5_LINAN|nr:F-box/LRR-repeat protein 7 [Lingula anatina]|eukprot:XP_013414781.1 F-box/LRR-repeat protein 7 [Lingula anatina]
MASYLCLPESILLMVFRYLRLDELCLGARKVCKTWHRLSYDSSLWKILDLQHLCYFMTDEKYLSMLPFIADHVEEINFEGCKYLTDRAFLQGGIKCPRLRSVNFNFTNITFSGLQLVITQFKGLKGISLIGCDKLQKPEPGCYEVPGNLHRALQNLKQLQTLSLASGDTMLGVLLDEESTEENFEQEERNGIVQLPLQCSQLTALTLSSHRRLKDRIFIEMAKNCVNVTKLHIPLCTGLTDEGFEQGFQYFPNLLDLDICHTDVKDSGMKSITENCKELQKLSVCGCKYITDMGYVYVGLHCSKLEELRICTDREYVWPTEASITDHGLTAISQNCPDLKHVEICRCSCVTDAGIISLAECCSGLEHLSVSGCLALTDASLHALSRCCKNLKVFTASECVQLKSEGINLLMISCPLLKHLELATLHYLDTVSFKDVYAQNDVAAFSHSQAGCNDMITSMDIVCEASCSSETQLAEMPSTHSHVEPRHAFQFRHLDLSLCSKIDNHSVIEIAKHCRELQILLLRGCHLVTDVAIATLAENCEKLQYLDISGSSTSSLQLTDKALLAIAEYGKSLEFLNITKNLLITESGISELLSKCPRLFQLMLTVDYRLHVPFQQVMKTVIEYHGYSNYCHPSAEDGTCMGLRQAGNVTLQFPSLLKVKLHRVLESKVGGNISWCAQPKF